MGTVKVLCTLIRRPRGGVESYIYNFHQHMDQSKIQVDYLIGNYDASDGFIENIKKLNGKVYILPKITLGNIFEFFITLNNFYKTHKEYKIIHSHSAISAIFFLLIAKLNGVKHRILHAHSTAYSEVKLRNARNFLLQLPAKHLATRYFACSKQAGEFVFGSGNKDKIFIAKNAIDAKRFSFCQNIRIKLRREYNIEEKFVIGHVGRFCYAKNHEFLIDIFKEIHELHKNSVLLLVGTGELENVIQKKVCRFGLEDSVIFLGLCSNVANLLQAMDVFIMPSRFEGLGIAAIESQAAGLKTIVSNVVPNEINITSLVEYISLNAPPSVWAKRALEYRNYERNNTYNDILKAGFDIKTEVKRLEKYYSDIPRE